MVTPVLLAIFRLFCKFIKCIIEFASFHFVVLFIYLFIYLFIVFPFFRVLSPFFCLSVPSFALFLFFPLISLNFSLFLCSFAFTCRYTLRVPVEDRQTRALVSEFPRGAWYVSNPRFQADKFFKSTVQYSSSLLKLQGEEACGCSSSLYTRKKRSTFTCFNFVCCLDDSDTDHACS